MSSHSPQYGGFWRRAAAFMIDFFAMIVPLYVLTTLSREGLIWVFETDSAGLNMANSLITTSFWWLYFALLNASAWQATIGKRALGMKIVGHDGQRISFARASARFVAEYLSLLTLFIGFMMAGWTSRKQSLHDLIVKTYVVRTNDHEPQVLTDNTH